ncbi:nucleotide pyrophosphohydrolase [Paraburkholderia kururiensis]|uniref:nucleotide pyrophosphohydrolase n=1 Tax=Paraburkholderia kururiensis TaxID=984307 RepID=UPI000F89253D|nr:nucleotide pyrophosphohydrolase [Paraburkholderia kururiensis]
MKLIDIDGLQRTALAFAEARGWRKFHNPKNLAMALSVEVAELVEIFQWKTPEESAAVMESGEREHVEQELADIAIYLSELVSVLGVDLDAAVRAKFELNARKYPAADGTSDV